MNANTLSAITAKIRWRARRGLLENDLLMLRFFDNYENTLTNDELIALKYLLDFSEHDLLNILFLNKNVKYSANILPNIIGLPTLLEKFHEASNRPFVKL